MRAGKHVMIEIPMADSLADSERLVRTQLETGVVAMAGQHAPLQPEPSVGTPADFRRRHQDPADGRPDLLLSPHEHERARQAAQLDRPPALASRLLSLIWTAGRTVSSRYTRCSDPSRRRCAVVSRSWTGATARCRLGQRRRGIRTCDGVSRASSLASRLPLSCGDPLLVG